MPVQVLAADWSGKLERAEEFIWLAEVRDGQLTSLENGRSADELVEHLIAVAHDQPRTVVGLDFAFSFPRWWCDQQGWRHPRQVWKAMAADGDRLLGRCEPPFWGRTGMPNPHSVQRGRRRTELVDVTGAKSVFQIGGAGAVGTASVRGMRHLLTLSLAGFDVWPFGPSGWPRVVEIYPRALTGPVNKSRWRKRHDLLHERFAGQPSALLERAAGSDDAFDAAVSALVMAENAAQLEHLSTTSDPWFAIEGRIWCPASLG
jgi:hypothetical protein